VKEAQVKVNNFAMTQRRSSLRAQGAAEKGCEVLRAAELFFVLDPVRKEIPDLQPKRYAQLRSRSQFCLTKCAPPVPGLSRAPRRSASSKQHLSPYTAPGYESARRGGGGWHVLIYLLPAYCLVYAARNESARAGASAAGGRRRSRQAEVAAGGGRGRWRRCSAELAAWGCWRPVCSRQPQAASRKKSAGHRAPGLLSVRSARLTGWHKP
jgi:hypothetical protein